jgi:hypothetical protein
VRKIILPLVLTLCLSGCATYKFQKGDAPYNGGYVVLYDGRLVPEYTVGADDSVPELSLARERFKRRRATVEYYYKKMGEIESRFKEMFWDPPAMCVDFLCGVLRWPFNAVDDYKYNRDPAYKEKVDRIDEQKDEQEKTRIKDLKAKLKLYIDEDLAKEAAGPDSGKGTVMGTVVLDGQPVESATGVKAGAAKEELVNAELEKIEGEIRPEPADAPVPAPAVIPAALPAENTRPAQTKEKPYENEAYPVAVIVARPAKGPSPLQVNFKGSQSYSKSGRIVSYFWDFGDGDTSTKKNPVNTYWSTTYGSRMFTVTLTVKDDRGREASVSASIEVVTE